MEHYCSPGRKKLLWLGKAREGPLCIGHWLAKNLNGAMTRLKSADENLIGILKTAGAERTSRVTSSFVSTSMSDEGLPLFDCDSVRLTNSSRPQHFAFQKPTLPYHMFLRGVTHSALTHN